jgi:hypothetical protein
MAINIKASHKGLLHRELGIKEDEPISVGKLMRAESRAKKTGNTKEEKRITFAENARKWHRHRAEPGPHD